MKKFILQDRPIECMVNENQICYTVETTIDGTVYEQLHMSNGEILTGTWSEENDAK